MVRATEEAEKNHKQLQRLLEKLKQSWIFVEGKKDKQALRAFECENVLTISGNLLLSCNQVQGKTDEVVILTDLDRRGEELAKKAKQELEGCSIRAEIETRKKLAGILKLRYFEDIKRKYDEFMEKMKELRLEGD